MAIPKEVKENQKRRDASTMFGGGPRKLNFEKPKDSWGLIKRLVAYIGRNKSLLIAILVMVVVSAVLGTFKPLILGSIIDLLTVGYRDGVDFNELYKYLSFLIGLTVVSSAVQYMQNYFSAQFSKKNIFQLREDTFNAVSLLPVQYMDTHSHGDTMSRLVNDTDNIAQVMSQTMGNFISSIVSVVTLTSIMLYLSPLLTLIVYVVVPISIFFTKYLSKRMRVYFREKHNSLGRLEESVEENIHGYETLLAYNRREHIQEEFKNRTEEYRYFSVKAGILSGMINPLMGLSAGFAYLIVAYTGAKLAISEIITIGTIQVFLLYVRQISQPLNGITSLYAQIQTALAGAERVFTLLDSTKEVNKGNKKFVEKSEENKSVGNINLNNVNFSYSEEKQVLTDFSLSIKSGQKIAIVGETGSGKTSIINILMRFYPIQSGEILIDNVNINDYDLQNFREHIALVPQDAFLFSESIRNNIQYFYVDKNKYTQEELDKKMIEASKATNAHDFIMQLPEQYDTILSSEGTNLSIGQKQLIALTRTFMQDSPILIMDEATANIDTLTEMHIQNAVFQLMKDRTCIIIAHRLSTIIRMDSIFVLDKGKIIEQGSHKELLEKKSAYYNLYMSQFYSEE